MSKFAHLNYLGFEMLDVAEDFSRPSLLLAPIELLSPKRRELNKETAFQFLPSRDSRDQSQFDST